VTHDRDIVAAIVTQLERGGPLRGGPPRDPPVVYQPPPVEQEAQRSVARMRRLWQTYGPPRPLPELADSRKAAKALHKTAFTDEQRTAVRQLKAVRQFPPERAGNPLAYHCAKEAFDLMSFSAKAPTRTDGGAFLTIAALLYEAATGTPDADMERACRCVLREQWRDNPNAFKRP
jgi:hypothetical protein